MQVVWQAIPLRAAIAPRNPQAKDPKQKGPQPPNGPEQAQPPGTTANQPVPDGPPNPAQVQANKQADEQVRNVTAPVDFAHVIGADYNPNSGKVTGGHSTLDGDVKIVSVSKGPDANGVYEAKVQMKDDKGNWIDKTSNGGNNAMFPTSWTENRIKVEIDGAWNSPTKVIDGNRWRAQSPSGVTIEGWLTPRLTAYPLHGVYK
jgi:hypothetical protein